MIRFIKTFLRENKRMKMLKKDHYKTLRANLKRYKNSLDIEVKKDDFYENEIE